MIILDILNYICIFIAYCVIELAAIGVLFFLTECIYFIKRVIVFNKEMEEFNFKKINLYILVVTFIISFVFLLHFFHYQLWRNDLILLWKSPVIMLLICIAGYMMLSMVQSSDPIVKGVNIIAKISFIPIVYLLLIGIIKNEFISEWTIKWGISSAIVGLPFIELLKFNNGLQHLGKYQKLEKIKKEIKSDIENLKMSVPYVSNIIIQNELQRLINNINQNYEDANKLFIQSNFTEAERLFVNSQNEINSLNQKYEAANELLEQGKFTEAERLFVNSQNEINTIQSKEAFDEFVHVDYKSELLEKYYIDDINENLTIYIPRICSTADVAKVIIWHKNQTNVNIDIKSLLINFNPSQVVLLSNDDYTRTCIKFVGEKPGNGNIDFDIDGIKKEYTVKIIPGKDQILKNIYYFVCFAFPSIFGLSTLLHSGVIFFAIAVLICIISAFIYYLYKQRIFKKYINNEEVIAKPREKRASRQQITEEEIVNRVDNNTQKTKISLFVRIACYGVCFITAMIIAKIIGTDYSSYYYLVGTSIYLVCWIVAKKTKSPWVTFIAGWIMGSIGGAWCILWFEKNVLVILP